MNSARLKHFPFFSDYLKHSNTYSPFRMTKSEPNYKSSTLNTDEFGYRVSSDKYSSKSIDFYSFLESENKNKTLILGGSATFGVGSSSDKTTISSILNLKSDFDHQNFGIRGYVSSQEAINFVLNFELIQDVNKVILFSGVNDVSVAVDGGADFIKESNLFFNEQKFISSEYSYSPRPFRPYNQYYLNEIDRSLSKIRSNLRAMLNLTEGISAELHYVIQPVQGWIESQTTLTESERIEIDLNQIPSLRITNSMEIGRYFRTSIYNICQELKIQCVDINNELPSKLNSREDDVFSDICHLTDYGYLLVSQTILEKCYV